MDFRRIRLSLAALVTVAAAAACSSSNGSDDGANAAACTTSIERFKELEIVDEAVMNDPRASNAQGGPWSFRHLIEQMTPDGTDGGAFVLAWLTDWATRKDLNGFTLDRESR